MLFTQYKSYIPVFFRRKTTWNQIFRWLSRLALVVGVLYVLAFLVKIGLNALTQALNFNGYPADGPFQLYNPLRRLAAGQVIGRDFQSFHGAGVPLVHFPLFRLLGANVFASEISRWTTSGIIFLASCLLLFRIALRSWQRSIIAASATLLVFVPQGFDYSIILPANSLLGVRTTIPIVFAAIYLLDIKKSWAIKGIKVPVRQLALGATVALGVLLGTEQGLALLLAYIAVEVVVNRQNLRQATGSLLWFGASAAVTLIGLLAIITAGHPLVPLRYALLEVAKDQSWYFGTPPNIYLSWSNLLPNLMSRGMLALYSLTAFIVAMIVLLRKAKFLSKEVAGLAAVLLTYGILALVIPAVGGYFGFGEAVPLRRIDLTLLVLLGTMIVFYGLDTLRENVHPARAARLLAPVSAVILAAFCLVAATQGVGYLTTANKDKVITLLKQGWHARHWSDYQDAGPPWRYRIDLFDKITEGSKSVWSIYAGLYESHAGIFQPSKQGHDYIIHALGPTRREAYEQQFIQTKPEYVITMRQFPFEEWIWQHHWPLYRELLSDYQMVGEDDTNFFWKRTDSPRNIAKSGWQSATKTDHGSFTLPGDAARPVVYEVRVEYQGKSTLPLTESLPRFLIQPSGSSNPLAVALPPYESVWQFPIVSLEGKPVALKPKADGLFPGQLTIKDFSYREIDPGDSGIKLFVDTYCYRLSAERKANATLCSPGEASKPLRQPTTNGGTCSINVVMVECYQGGRTHCCAKTQRNTEYSGNLAGCNGHCRRSHPGDQQTGREDRAKTGCYLTFSRKRHRYPRRSYD